MGSDLITGLRISVIGMSITFLALGLLILVMILLVAFFRIEAPPAKKTRSWT